jgi:hypothetical protein
MLRQGTHRYIDPSKKHDARPKVRIRRSLKTVRSVDLAGEFSGDRIVSFWWLSP